MEQNYFSDSRNATFELRQNSYKENMERLQNDYILLKYLIYRFLKNSLNATFCLLHI